MTTFRYRPPTRPAGLDPVLVRLRGLTTLDDADIELLAGLDDWRADPPGVELVRERGPSPPRLLIEGWAARISRLGDGRRQILSFVLPGEFMGLRLRSETIGASLTVAMTGVQTLDATPVTDACRAEHTPARGLVEALSSLAALEDARLLAQVVRLGRQTAYERMCHLMLELYESAASAGLARDGRMPFPLTQDMLADATGLSIVHVNRVLQLMRKERLVEIKHGTLVLLKPDDLAAIADYHTPVIQTR